MKEIEQIAKDRKDRDLRIQQKIMEHYNEYQGSKADELMKKTMEQIRYLDEA